jgi:hypothetical protein
MKTSNQTDRNRSGLIARDYPSEDTPAALPRVPGDQQPAEGSLPSPIDGWSVPARRLVARGRPDVAVRSKASARRSGGRARRG